MKKKLYTIAMLIFAAVQIHYGQVELGVRGGLNFNNIQVSGLPEFIPDTKTLTGPHIGLHLEFPVSDGWSLISGFGYAQKGFLIEESMDLDVLGFNVPIGVKVQTRLHYLELPFAMKYTFDTGDIRPYAIAGASLGYATSGYLQPKATAFLDFNLPGTEIDLSDDIYNRFEASGLIGAGMEIDQGYGKIFADVRYQHAFTNTLDDPIIDISLKNTGVSLGIGYAMSF